MPRFGLTHEDDDALIVRPDLYGIAKIADVATNTGESRPTFGAAYDGALAGSGVGPNLAAADPRIVSFAAESVCHFDWIHKTLQGYQLAHCE